MSPNEPPDSQTLLHQIVREWIQEKKRKRYWRWLKRIMLLVFIVFIFCWVFYKDAARGRQGTKPHIGLIDIEGTIFPTAETNAEHFAKSLHKAYKNSGLKALIIRINSPGGSPVQADYMYNLLQFYRKKHPEIKTYAVCVDLCASAAYYVAAGSQHIYANPASLIGSIGVVYNGFGFDEAMHKIGITRRLQTAGEHKGFLDPFSPETTVEKQHLQALLDSIHMRFIAAVKSGRGSRLLIDDNTFSGLIWTGEQALARGLIDGFASTGQLAREIIKINKIIDYTYSSSFFEQFSKNIGTAVTNQFSSALGLQNNIKLQ